MSWIVNFNGRDLDVDPFELTGLELSQIKKRADLRLTTLIEGLKELDGEAIQALFWAAEHRYDPDLKFTEYSGPTVGFFLENLGGLVEAVTERMGKVTVPEEETTTGTGGSPSSPSTSDGPAETMTL